MGEQSDERMADEESLDDLEVTDEDADDVKGGVSKATAKSSTDKSME